MNFHLKDVLQAIGPNAAIIFAAWIFMDFLQQRYLAALETYRALIGQYRDGDGIDCRHRNVRDKILLYKRRCELMKRATNLGLVAAILLIVTLIAAELNAVFSGVPALKFLSAASALGGLVLIVVAASIAIMENSVTQRAIDSELFDVPDRNDGLRR